MDGTSLYVNLRTGPGGTGLPPGSQVGDLVQWNGAEWVNVQPSVVLDETRKYQNIYQGNVPEIIVPAGYKLVSMHFAARAGYTSVAQLSGGTDSSVDNLFQSKAIEGRDETYNPEGLTNVDVNRVFSLTSAITIYLNTINEGDTWAGMHFDLYIVLKPLK